MNDMNFRTDDMIYLDAEVAVIGGGLSGMCAALASARHGAKTVLIQEPFLDLGIAEGRIGIIRIAGNIRQSFISWIDAKLLQRRFRIQ